jgi:hypothetical protein
VAVGVLLITGCARGVVTRSTDNGQAALLRHLIADADSVRAPVGEISNPPAPSGETVFQVDPRPLRRMEEPADSAEPWFARVDSTTVAQRAAVIRASGWQPVHALPFMRCPRRMFSDSLQAGCPRSLTLIAAFGRLARVPTDTLPVVVRVQWFELDPRGQRIWEYRYLVQRAAHGWRTLERRLIGVMG